MSPGEILGNYLNALIGGRTEEAYSYLSIKDRAGETLPDFKMRRSPGSGLIAELMARKISFTIEKADTVDGQAMAVATVTAPDFVKIMDDVWHDMGSAGFPAGNVDAFLFVCQKLSHFLDKYRQEAIPMRTDTASFRLILEKSGWKICGEDR